MMGKRVASAVSCVRHGDVVTVGLSSCKRYTLIEMFGFLGMLDMTDRGLLTGARAQPP